MKGFKMYKRAEVLFVLSLFIFFNCGPKIQVPPEIDLKEYSAVGIIQFSTEAKGKLGEFTTEKFLEEHNIIKQLDDYPVFDEQILSIIEDEMHDEEWDNYESEDFMKLLLEKFPQQEEKIQELFDYDKLYSLYYECTNLYQLTPECDGYNWIFHTDFMCEKLSEEYIKNFNVEE